MPQTEAALAAGSERPAVHLCVVPGLADRQELVAAGCTPARWSPFGAYLTDGDPAAIAAVAEGRAGVQDEASQLAAAALARVGLDGADARWLDMCAGPGGKARLLAGLATRLARPRLALPELARPKLARPKLARPELARQERAGRAGAGRAPGWWPPSCASTGPGSCGPR